MSRALARMKLQDAAAAMATAWANLTAAADLMDKTEAETRIIDARSALADAHNMTKDLIGGMQGAQG